MTQPLRLDSFYEDALPITKSNFGAEIIAIKNNQQQ